MDIYTAETSRVWPDDPTRANGSRHPFQIGQCDADTAQTGQVPERTKASTRHGKAAEHKRLGHSSIFLSAVSTYLLGPSILIHFDYPKSFHEGHASESVFFKSVCCSLAGSLLVGPARCVICERRIILVDGRLSDACHFPVECSTYALVVSESAQCENRRENHTLVKGKYNGCSHALYKSAIFQFSCSILISIVILVFSIRIVILKTSTIIFILFSDQYRIKIFIIIVLIVSVDVVLVPFPQQSCSKLVKGFVSWCRH